MKQLTIFFEINLPDLSDTLPVFGTIGLILIVLEGSLELEMNKSKFGLIRKSFLGALFPIIALAVSITLMFSYLGNAGLKDGLINAIPFCIISSAIAIPSARNLDPNQKEFVIYESSLSDILGVLLFNFVTINEIIDLQSFGIFGWQILIILVISFIAAIGLSILLNKIEHHIKFIPIILLIILIYMVSKVYHLPGLIFILLFGLFIGNLDEIKHFRLIRYFNTDAMNKEVQKFKELTIEATFLIRALFFLLFGFMIETTELLNTSTILWAVVIVILIFLFRIIQLKISKLPLKHLLFIAPRGLITILLFISIEPFNRIPFVNNSLIIQVIILTALVMMFGLMTPISKKNI
jgi:hypothetical protein